MEAPSLLQCIIMENQSNQINTWIVLIAKLECTLSNAQQIIEKIKDPKMGVTINIKSTTTEPPS